MKKKIVKSKKRVPKFQDGGIKLKPRTALEAAKNLKIGSVPFIGPLNEADTAAKDKEKEAKIRDLIGPKAAITASPIVTPKSVVAKSSKTVSDSYKKSLQGLMDKGKSIDELVKLGYGSKQGLTNLGLTAPKKATATKPVATNPTTPKKVTAPKKPTTTKPSTSKKPTASDLKKEGQRLKAEGMKQKGIGMAIKGKGLRNKAIAETRYVVRGYINRTNKLERKIEEIKQGKKQTKEGDYLPDKSVLTETEKKAAAKYKESPKYKRNLKFQKKLEAVKSGESNYRPNIVGDLIGGPVAAVGAVGAGLYGLYKVGKNLSNVGKAFTKSVATKAAKAGAKQFANKRALKVVRDLSKKRTLTQSAKKSFDNATRLTKEKLGREFAKNLTEKAAKNASKKGAQKLLGPGKGATPAKGTQLKFNFRKGGKVTKMKKNGKKC